MWKKPAGIIMFLVLCVAAAAGIYYFSSYRYILEARKILRETGTEGGLVVHLGAGNYRLLHALHAGENYLVHALSPEKETVEQVRKYLQKEGSYGEVSVEFWNRGYLPYIENLVNLVVADETVDIEPGEIMRILAPGGVAYIRQGRDWEKIVKPQPPGVDEWTHYLHGPDNNAVARDTVIAPPRRLQWSGGPRWGRHHDRMTSMSAMVSAAGRIFYILDEGSRASIMTPSHWKLVARDAFNGKILWKRSIEEWYPRVWPLKNGPSQVPRRLVAKGDTVFVSLGLKAPLSALDAATGKTLKDYPSTAATEEIIYSGGILYLVVNRDESKWDRFSPTEFDQTRATDLWPWVETHRQIMALNAGSGDQLWEREAVVIPVSLTVDERKLYYLDQDRIVCLDRKTGAEMWYTKGLERKFPMSTFFGPTMVVQQDVLLYSGGGSEYKGGGGMNTMTAISTKNGKMLWEAEHPPSASRSPEDLFVIDGMVWTNHNSSSGSSGRNTGRDLHTGEIMCEFLPDVRTYWFHHRCYRGRATERYMLSSRTGIEFIDLKEQSWDINHWTRGGCSYGIMPANGLIYTPAHDCACFPEAQLSGFCALAPTGGYGVEIKMDMDNRLEKGPAYERKLDYEDHSRDEWNTFRHDAQRSGSTGFPVASSIKRAWKTELGGNLSTLTSGAGLIFVSRKDAHTLYALDANDGKPVWQYTAEGRVDSPPTWYKGRILFGSVDGHVYCLAADNGELIWKFRAAPMDLRLVSCERLESLWPLHGSVLVNDDVLYVVAGRSMFLDGGLHLYRLDPMTGKVLSEEIMDETIEGTDRNLQSRIQKLNMPVALPDILSSDGKYVYMKSQRFTLEGKRCGTGPHSGTPPLQASVQSGEGRHLFAPFGFLDDSWFHRSYWVYGKSFAGGHSGYSEAGKYTPGGRMMVFDEENIYSFARKPEYYQWTTPLEYHIYAVYRSESVDTVNDSRIRFGVRPGRPMEYRWANNLAILVRAMVKAGDNIFVAGPPDLLDEPASIPGYASEKVMEEMEEADRALRGEMGMRLLVISASDGRVLAEYIHNSLPVFDGLIALNGRLYLSTQDGDVLCFEGT